MKINKINIVLIFFVLMSYSSFAQNKKINANEEMVFIKGGIYTPLYISKKEGPGVEVTPFFIDKYAVTNSQFLKFVKENPRWQRSKAKKLFADENYLSSWKDDLELGENVLPNGPVTNISWFAAKAYCEYYKKRLPSVAEWELVAKASVKQADGSKDQNYIKQILEWYSQPTTEKISPVGSRGKNYWGIYDMHGLVWEWTSDFFSSLVTGESRGDSGLERNLFCGSGSVNASDFKNYPAFMRSAFRSSLKANYTTSNLGFRCAKDYK
ncbi:MAG: formylglycine-generating enzyme family protein [Ignavibacteriales bacterium]|nr:formylglycine-generating enzyme family protein [Ignavibacteriales bacterium]